MKCLLLVAGFAALCLAADTTSKSSDSVNATTPSSITTQSVNLRPEDLFTANSTSDTIFPDIHSLESSNLSLPLVPAYKVNTSESGTNLMETTTAKQTYIMKVNVTRKPEPHPEPHPEPEPTAEPEPAGSSSKPTPKPSTSKPKTSGAATLTAPLVVLAASLLAAKLC